MSLDKSDKKNSQRRESDIQQHKVKGSYTEQGFYRKPNNQYGMGLSNLSQKQSVYDTKTHMNPINSSVGVQQTTLNPSKYGCSDADLLQDQQYEVLAVFELNRQRQKNRILQKRLMNKEIHIAKMKEVHNQLTEAFEKCQAQLEFYKRKCSQPTDVREYVEEINELKHLVIRLQDKITEYQRQESKRYNSVRQSNGHGAEQTRNISNFRPNESGKSGKVRDKRSKTVAYQQDSSPQFKKFDIIQEYVLKYPNRITNFISQFMGMVQCFSAEAQNAKAGEDRNNTKKRLKIGWKWIKQVVVEWNHFKNYIERVQYFHNRLRKIFNIPDSKNDSEIIDIILTTINN